MKTHWLFMRTWRSGTEERGLWAAALALFLTAIASVAADPTDSTQRTNPTDQSDRTAPADPQPATAGKEDSDETEESSRDFRRREVVRFGQPFVLEADEEAKEVVVLFAPVTIKGKVRDNVVVIGGKANITGQVGGDLVVVMGAADLGPKSKVGGEMVVVGGGANIARGADVRKQPVAVAFGPVFDEFNWVTRYFSEGLLQGRPIAPGVGWAWGAAAVFLGLYFMLALVFPKPVAACVGVLEERPVGAFFSGLAAFILLGPLVIVLVMSIAGILILPLLFCAVLAALLFGKAAVYRYTGLQLGRQAGGSTLQLPLVSLLIGGVLFILLYTIPFLGFLVWGAILPLAVGAAVMAAVAGLRRESGGASGGISRPGGGGQSSALPVDPATGNPTPPLMAVADETTYARAGFWARFIATCLDGFLIIWVTVISGPMVILVWPLYHMLMWWWKGTTIGGIVLGLKVVRLDGRPVDFATALVRALASFFSAIVLFVGFFWASWDRERQSWHDKIAGTTIVKVPKGISLI